MTTLGLAQRPGRCANGFDIATQHPGLCGCPARVDEWAIFTAALKQAADSEGVIHQGDVRPLIQAIPHKHRGLMYRRARQEGLLVEDGWEQSTDVAGRNADKQQRRYRLVAAA